MRFTVVWKVNDGKDGYPNIMSEDYSGIVRAQSYSDAIMYYAAHKDVYGMLPHGIKATEIGRGRGKHSECSYRDYKISYASKKPVGQRTRITKQIRVYCEKV